MYLTETAFLPNYIFSRERPTTFFGMSEIRGNICQIFQKKHTMSMYMYLIVHLLSGLNYWLNFFPIYVYAIVSKSVISLSYALLIPRVGVTF